MNDNTVRLPLPANCRRREVRIEADVDIPRRMRLAWTTAGLVVTPCIGCGMPVVVTSGVDIALYDAADIHDESIGALCRPCTDDRPSPPVPVTSVRVTFDE